MIKWSKINFLVYMYNLVVIRLLDWHKIFCLTYFDRKLFQFHAGKLRDASWTTRRHWARSRARSSQVVSQRLLSHSRPYGRERWWRSARTVRLHVIHGTKNIKINQILPIYAIIGGFRVVGWIFVVPHGNGTRGYGSEILPHLHLWASEITNF